MFGHNEIVGQKSFPDDHRLLVTSYFATLQGEGPFSGRRAVFLRLAKCNLACSFCDTYFDSGDWLLLDDVGNRLLQQVRGITPEWGLVITGGEPLLQKALTPFLEQELVWWDWIQIESNGIVPRDIPRPVTLVVSPKCVEKDGVAVRYIKPHASNLERADCLKFVMQAEVGPYCSVPDWALDWKKATGREVYVSPMNVYAREPKKARVERNSNRTTIEDRSTIEEVISFWEPGLFNLQANERNHKWAATYAIEHDLRFQVQAHLYAGLA